MAQKALVFLLLVAMACAAPKSMPPQCNTDLVFCPTSYMPGNYLTADPERPCGYCQCIWGSPVQMACAPGLGWNDMYSQCIPKPGC